MRIVVVSDTHMPRMAKALPGPLLRELRSADHILHAGDWCSMEVYEQLSAFAPVTGVAGNNDGSALVRRLGYRQVLQVEGLSVGLVHGHGRVAAWQQALDTFKGERLDAIVFGHSHVPLHKDAGGTLLFNPGSATDKRRQPEFSFGIMEIAAGRLHARHIYYADKHEQEGAR
ncbi:metallophosphoesterase [Paenibacillus sp. IB182496]|uniref:Phosphoesterase n=1 Tax=Paenibacillus sabuli TaxID=2772509 RepID=A0A927GSI0_9BACL|nr:metallophosphoesterase family protein [Paenibacillus sabuli]MBD2846764.1 metallophosphoesterase [Paenibacillus sabuli]